MNRRELSNALGKKVGTTAIEAEKMICALIELIQDEVKNGTRVRINGFGSFYMRTRAEKEVYHPATGNRTIAKEHNALAFKSYQRDI